jgi:hypothetical protein
MASLWMQWLTIGCSSAFLALLVSLLALAGCSSKQAIVMHTYLL